MNNLFDIVVNYDEMQFWWAAVIIPGYFVVNKLLNNYAAKKREEQVKFIEGVFDEYMRERDGTKNRGLEIVERIFDQKIAPITEKNDSDLKEVKKDIKTVSVAVADFINAYYSKLETLMLKLTGGG